MDSYFMDTPRECLEPHWHIQVSFKCFLIHNLVILLFIISLQTPKHLTLYNTIEHNHVGNLEELKKMKSKSNFISKSIEIP